VLVRFRAHGALGAVPQKKSLDLPFRLGRETHPSVDPDPAPGMHYKSKVVTGDRCDAMREDTNSIGV
jgi:hypothetical protein